VISFVADPVIGYLELDRNEFKSIRPIDMAARS